LHFNIDNRSCDRTNAVLYATNNTRNIYLLSAGDFTLIKTIPARVVPEKFTVDTEYLYFIGQYEYESYLLDKIKL
jgi:hypothetical protein